MQSLRKTKIYTYHKVAEQSEELYGFFSLATKRLFEMLITVQGIGPKAAAQIILDMKGSLSASLLPANTETTKKVKLNKEQEDAKNVLKALGFKAKDIDDVLENDYCGDCKIEIIGMPHSYGTSDDNETIILYQFTECDRIIK